MTTIRQNNNIKRGFADAVIFLPTPLEIQNTLKQKKTHLPDKMRRKKRQCAGHRLK